MACVPVPGGQEISYRHKAASGGELDVDMCAVLSALKFLAVQSTHGRPAMTQACKANIVVWSSYEGQNSSTMHVLFLISVSSTEAGNQLRQLRREACGEHRFSG